MSPWLPRYLTYRDSFLPEALRVAAARGPGREARWRAQRLISMLLVVGSAALLSATLQAVQGLWRVAPWVAAGGGAVGGLLLLVRRGVSVERLGTGLAVAGALCAGGLAVASGRDGVYSLAWTGLAPIIALAVSGHRAAWRLLAFTALVDAAAVFLIYRGAVPVVLPVADHPGAHLVSLLGAVVSYFVLVRVYEGEMVANLSELEVVNVALVEAQRQAEAAAAAKSNFLATMSHEIRTPMNGVLGMTTVMLAEELPPRVREGLVVIQQSGDTLLAILNDVLDYSKIDAGRLVLESIPVDLRALLESTARLFREAAAERQVTLRCTVADAVPPAVLGDPTRLRQVVLNLVSNAVKFSSQAEVHLALAVDEAGRLALSVEDHGVGMSAQTLAGLFHPFTQGDSSTTRRFGGTGLGLAITRRLVEAMGGAVSATSALGQGSRFTVSLPLQPASAPRPSPGGAPQVSRAHLRVLVVEDNAINRIVATRLLEQLGHETLVAPDGAAALSQLETGPAVDLVLMDCHMPVMDGFEATRHLRRTEVGAHLPIVALTASTLPQETAQCLASGMDLVLHKPLRRPELEEALARFHPVAR